MYNILMTADENYAKYVSVLITSIIKNTQKDKSLKDFYNESNNATSIPQLPLSVLESSSNNEVFTFHILTDFLTDYTKQRLQRLIELLDRIYPCKIAFYTLGDDDFHGCPKQGAELQNFLTYYRLRVDTILPKNVKCCLYLDVDMLVTSDIRWLFTLDLSDFVAAVVRDSDYRISRYLTAKDSSKKNFSINVDKYFNAGFMLINIDKWREMGVWDSFMRLASEYVPLFHDQDIMNVIISNNVLWLGLEYNLQRHSLAPHAIFNDYPNHNIAFSRKENDYALDNPKILHYNWGGDAKPWSNYKALFDDSNDVMSAQVQQWWDVALGTPIFREELKNIYAQNRVEYLQLAQNTLKSNVRKMYALKLKYRIKNFLRKIRGKEEYYRI